MGAALAEILSVPYISLDELFWKPGWEVTPKDEFRAKIRRALDQSDRGWIVDGNYHMKGGSMVTDECTDVICKFQFRVHRARRLIYIPGLDPPLVLYFPRIVARTMLRLFRLRPPCSSGCMESWREAFLSKESILWWCLSNHWAIRRKFQAMMAEIGIITDSSLPDRKMRRLGGWGEEQRKCMTEVVEICRAK